MARKLFIGDTVDTPDGKGTIMSVTTWRDKIIDMDDCDAVDFSSECKRLVGNTYKEDWVEVEVKIGDTFKKFMIAHIEKKENICGQDENKRISIKNKSGSRKEPKDNNRG